MADCFPPAKSDPVFACVRLCVSVCSRADDRGHGLPTRGTANEKEAFPLTFHGSQKQFAQRKVAKQPQSYSVKLVQGGGRETAKANRSVFLQLSWEEMCCTLQRGCALILR